MIILVKMDLYITEVSFLTKHIQNVFLILIIQVIVVMITLWVAIFILNRLLQKITKGVFQKIT